MNRPQRDSGSSSTAATAAVAAAVAVAAVNLASYSADSEPYPANPGPYLTDFVTHPPMLFPVTTFPADPPPRDHSLRRDGSANYRLMYPWIRTRLVYLQFSYLRKIFDKFLIISR